MQKSQLISNIQESELTEDLKQELILKVQSYQSEELTADELKEFDSLLAELQTEEVESSLFLQEMADDTDQYLEELAQLEENENRMVVKKLHNSLDAMQTMVQ